MYILLPNPNVFRSVAIKYQTNETSEQRSDIKIWIDFGIREFSGLNFETYNSGEFMLYSL